VDSLRTKWGLTKANQDEIVGTMVLMVATGQERKQKVCLRCGFSDSTKCFHKHKKKGPCDVDLWQQGGFSNLQQTPQENRTTEELPVQMVWFIAPKQETDFASEEVEMGDETELFLSVEMGLQGNETRQVESSNDAK